MRCSLLDDVAGSPCAKERGRVGADAACSAPIEDISDSGSHRHQCRDAKAQTPLYRRSEYMALAHKQHQKRYSQLLDMMHGSLGECAHTGGVPPQTPKTEHVPEREDSIDHDSAKVRARKKQAEKREKREKKRQREAEVAAERRRRGYLEAARVQLGIKMAELIKAKRYRRVSYLVRHFASDGVLLLDAHNADGASTVHWHLFIGSRKRLYLACPTRSIYSTSARISADSASRMTICGVLNTGAEFQLIVATGDTRLIAVLAQSDPHSGDHCALPCDVSLEPRPRPVS